MQAFSQFAFFVYHKEGGIDGIPGETRPFRHRFTSMQW